MRTFGCDFNTASRYVDIKSEETLYSNGVYLVDVSPPMRATLGWPAIIHLSVSRLDHTPIRDWAVMQCLKNIFVGPEYEAMEIYPAESRLVDCAHQYHLWVFNDSKFRIPIGWTTRQVRPNSPKELA